MRIENICFGYQPDRQILRGVTLSASSGTVTAIVGATGSGKSTLMSMLLRLYNPDGGAIFINDTELNQMSTQDVRANISIALQQNILFATSVAENIRYGMRDVDDAQVIAAAKVSNADGFICSLADGYDTELGERGGKLSTGQRQRISIARAVLRDTPILILDEPTASLDAETERQVMTNLAAWAQSRVVFIITHRLSTIRNADQIAFLEDGVVKELGTHQQLLALQGPYAEFVVAELGTDKKQVAHGGGDARANNAGTGSAKLYDDRIDVDTDLTLTDTFVLIGRSIGLLAKVKRLFAYKFIFATVALLPALILPWLLKIAVDQVILQQPLDPSVRFPPFFDPFLHLIQGMAPNQIMIALTALSLVLLALFGMRAMPSIQTERDGLPAGHDAATQSEQALSAGGSQARW